MTDQESTERLAAVLVAKLSKPEQMRLFRCKRELEKVLRTYGPLGTIAYAVLGAELNAGKKAGEIIVEQSADTPEPEAA